jgi:hypothetical protein
MIHFTLDGCETRTCIVRELRDSAADGVCVDLVRSEKYSSSFFKKQQNAQPHGTHFSLGMKLQPQFFSAFFFFSTFLDLAINKNEINHNSPTSSFQTKKINREVSPCHDTVWL